MGTLWLESAMLAIRIWTILEVSSWRHWSSVCLSAQCSF
uniref:Uncharacterized protein n=1 Tax=Anguilla anguilla TaxID=7936 RepID=A0A0E9SLS5_ANGAN